MAEIFQIVKLGMGKSKKKERERNGALNETCVIQVS